MTRSDMKIRDATPEDIDAIVDLTKSTNQFHTPAVDGKNALARALSFKNNVVLVCVPDDAIEGFVLGSWDGARAIIHKISVHLGQQNCGVGRALVTEAAKRFKDMGAPTIGVTAADGTSNEENNSIPFWEKLGFVPVAARLMVHFNINELDGD